MTSLKMICIPCKVANRVCLPGPSKKFLSSSFQNSSQFVKTLKYKFFWTTSILLTVHFDDKILWK